MACHLRYDFHSFSFYIHDRHRLDSCRHGVSIRNSASVSISLSRRKRWESEPEPGTKFIVSPKQKVTKQKRHPTGQWLVRSSSYHIGETWGNAPGSKGLDIETVALQSRSQSYCQLLRSTLRDISQENFGSGLSSKLLSTRIQTVSLSFGVRFDRICAALVLHWTGPANASNPKRTDGSHSHLPSYLARPCRKVRGLSSFRNQLELGSVVELSASLTSRQSSSGLAVECQIHGNPARVLIEGPPLTSDIVLYSTDVATTKIWGI